LDCVIETRGAEWSSWLPTESGRRFRHSRERIFWPDSRNLGRLGAGSSAHLRCCMLRPFYSEMRQQGQEYLLSQRSRTSGWFCRIHLGVDCSPPDALPCWQDVVAVCRTPTSSLAVFSEQGFRVVAARPAFAIARRVALRHLATILQACPPKRVACFPPKGVSMDRDARHRIGCYQQKPFTRVKLPPVVTGEC
jgi:hypothetical protein